MEQKWLGLKKSLQGHLTLGALKEAREAHAKAISREAGHLAELDRAYWSQAALFQEINRLNANLKQANDTIKQLTHDQEQEIIQNPAGRIVRQQAAALSLPCEHHRKARITFQRLAPMNRPGIPASIN